MTAYAALDAWMKRKLAIDVTPGLSLVITDREKTLYTGTYGMADIAAGAPVNANHVFEIGSIGKSFTALLLLRMQERGQIDLQQPVTTYLPWFEVKSSHEPITIHHLLTHTAGIISGSDMSADGRYEAWHLRETEVMGPPGGQFSYSNVGYKTLGYLIENVLGKPYGEAVTEEILFPIGMTESFSPITDAERPRVAVAYRRQFLDRPYRPEHQLMPDTWIETSTADGSIASTPRDMAIYARLLLDRGQGLISDESFSLMIGDLAPRHRWEPTGTYGYGLMTWEEDGKRLIGHSGGMVGHYAQLTIDPEAGIGVATMINGPGSPSAYADAALSFAQRMVAGETTPNLPVLHERTVIENASDFAGTYTGATGVWTITVDGTSLYLERGDQRTQLQMRRKDQFFADDPALDRDLIGFERDDEETVTALHHGPAWFGRDGIGHDEPEPAPERWSAYTGWYLSHNPWLPLIRVLERHGKLLLGSPHEADEPLFELSDGAFQVGEPPSAERLRFDAIADGLALRVDYSGQMFYRTPASSVKARAGS